MLSLQVRSVLNFRLRFSFKAPICVFQQPKGSIECSAQNFVFNWLRIRRKIEIENPGHLIFSRFKIVNFQEVPTIDEYYNLTVVKMQLNETSKQCDPDKKIEKTLRHLLFFQQDWKSEKIDMKLRKKETI